ncbi:23S rRNA (adenine(2030)-N(6))-methyltransferase RlmJ, partial [Pseudomonas aeruginosa]
DIGMVAGVVSVTIVHDDCSLDSHSGVGLYDLQGDEASRTGEWEQGIARLWEREGLPEQLDDYLDVIRHLNPDGSLRYYPG